MFCIYMDPHVMKLLHVFHDLEDFMVLAEVNAPLSLVLIESYTLQNCKYVLRFGYNSIILFKNILLISVQFYHIVMIWSDHVMVSQIPVVQIKFRLKLLNLYFIMKHLLWCNEYKHY